jgi:hypothetical protein
MFNGIKTVLLLESPCWTAGATVEFAKAWLVATNPGDIVFRSAKMSSAESWLSALMKSLAQVFDTDRRFQHGICPWPSCELRSQRSRSTNAASFVISCVLGAELRSRMLRRHDRGLECDRRGGAVIQKRPRPPRTATHTLSKTRHLTHLIVDPDQGIDLLKHRQRQHRFNKQDARPSG